MPSEGTRSLIYGALPTSNEPPFEPNWKGAREFGLTEACLCMRPGIAWNGNHDRQECFPFVTAYEQAAMAVDVIPP